MSAPVPRILDEDLARGHSHWLNEHEFEQQSESHVQEEPAAAHCVPPPSPLPPPPLLPPPEPLLPPPEPPLLAPCVHMPQSSFTQSFAEFDASEF